VAAAAVALAAIPGLGAGTHARLVALPDNSGLRGWVYAV